MKKTTSKYIKVKSSSIHNKGVFAKKKIPKGEKVIEYVGEKITKAESDRRALVPLKKNEKNSAHGAVYLFNLNKRYDIDGLVKYNTARFINHSCDPNCETEIIRGKIWIMSIRDIKKGEELAYNYGYDYEDYEDHKCRCRSKACVGYIVAEEFFKKVRKKEKAKKTKKAKRRK